MKQAMRDELRATLDEIRDAGLTTRASARSAAPRDAPYDSGGREVLNFCANNYLGLADDPAVVAAAQRGARRVGLRDGQRPVHLRHADPAHGARAAAVARSSAPRPRSCTRSCFDANGGVFEALLGAEDAMISDELNHASIIDGIRLCKAARLRYRNRDMADLEAQLQARAADARRRLIVTDGVFSMDGYLAPLDEICDLAERYDALVMVDDSHAVGFVGPSGARHARAVRRAGPGRHRHRHARQGARRRLRRLRRRPAPRSSTCCASGPGPYLFSNTVAPAVVAGSLAALDLRGRRRASSANACGATPRCSGAG